MEEVKEFKEPKFNFGVDYSQQIAIKIKEASEHYVNGRLDLAYRTLDALYMIVHVRLDKKQIDTITKLLDSINRILIVRHNKSSTIGISGSVNTLVYTKVHETFIALNDAIHECGLGMPNEESDFDATQR